MKPMKPADPGSRVFIAGLRNLEIVFLPESGQIVSRVPARAREHEEVKSGTAPQAGTDAAAGRN